jgi:RNA recognition motif-containing protein
MAQKLYVGGLPYSTTDQELADAFAAAGTVVSSSIVIDRMTNRSRGFGFVEMSNSNEATQAIEGLNGSEFSGRQMNVSEAKPQAPRDNRTTGRSNRY